MTDLQKDDQTIDSIDENDNFPIVHIHRALDCPVKRFLPQRVGYFSIHVYSDGRPDTYHPDSSSLTYLKSNYMNYKKINLLEDYPMETQYFSVPREIGHILQWTENQPAKAICSDVHFICTSSRTLRLILNVPHNPTVQWTILAIKLGTTIVLTMADPHVTGKNVFTSSKSKKIRKSYIANKFIDLITLKSDERPPSSHAGGNRESFYTVNKFCAGPHKILYPTRIDCLIDRKQFERPLSKMETALIKSRSSSRQPSETDVTQAIGWWSAAFLSGSETIVCGEREGSTNHLQDVSMMTTETLLSVQSDHSPSWSPTLCVEHLNYILDVIWYNVREDKTVYSFRWNRDKQGLEYKRLEDSFTDHIPKWYYSQQSTG